MKKISKAKMSSGLEEALAHFGPQGSPAFILLSFANDISNPKTLRLLACEKLLPFIHARLSKLEVGDPNGNALQGATFIDQINVVAQLYSARANPEKRQQLLAALNAPAPALEASEDDASPE